MENPPVKVAFIIDGKVVDVLHTDERLASIFLSEPVVIDVTKIYNDAAGVINMTNWDWDGQNFSYPAILSHGEEVDAQILAVENYEIEEADKQV
jgi:hypothetical protein